MNSRRTSPRINRTLRIGFRTHKNGVWCRGNAINVSSGGLFFVSYDDMPPKESFAIEIYDLDNKPIHTQGRVAWFKSWHDGPSLPGFGVEFGDPLPTALLH